MAKPKMMPHSKCVYCESCYYIDEAKGRLVPGFECIIDEWDEYTSCTRGGCRYYARRFADRLAQWKKREADNEKQ